MASNVLKYTRLNVRNSNGTIYLVLMLTLHLDLSSDVDSLTSQLNHDSSPDRTYSSAVMLGKMRLNKSLAAICACVNSAIVS